MSSAVLIARKDLRELYRDRRLTLLSGLVLMLALLAVSAAYVRVSAYEADRTAAEQRDRHTWEGQGERNPHAAAHFASWAMRPQTPLSLLEPGIMPYAGSAIWMEAHRQNPPLARPLEDTASVFDLGVFSTAWVLQILVPLLVGVISAGAVARERERGTLRMLLISNAGGVVRGKLLALLATVAALLLPVLFAAVAATVFAGPVEPLRLVLWMAAYLVYFIALCAAAVAVSLRSRTAAQAMLWLVSFWLLLVLVVPRASGAVVALLAPVPTSEAFWQAVADDRAQLPQVFGKDAAAFTQSVLESYGVDTVDALPVNLGGLQLDEDERLAAIVFDRHFGALEERYRDQRSWLRLLSVVTPLAALQNVSMAIAGTDMYHQLSFQNQAEAHRRDTVGMLNRDLAEHGRAEGFAYTANATLWKTIPEFRYRPPALTAVMRHCAADMLLLIAWLAASLILLRQLAVRAAAEVR